MTACADSPFKVRLIPALRILDVELRGLLACEDVHALADAIRAAVPPDSPPGTYRLVYDITGCKIQPQIVVAAMREVLTTANVTQDFAIVVGPSLMRMQLRRILAVRCKALLFDTRNEAWHWAMATRLTSA